MALLHSFSLPSGISLPEAYAKIASINLTQTEFIANVIWYVCSEARAQEKPIIHSASYSLTHSASVSLAGAYAALKLFPEFAEAEDC